jgi:regulator of protease activity HflC (stomatin/prohibitin superfamily)
MMMIIIIIIIIIMIIIIISYNIINLQEEKLGQPTRTLKKKIQNINPW